MITTSLVKDAAHEADTAQEAATMHATPQQGVGHCDCTETIQCGLCANVVTMMMKLMTNTQSIRSSM